MTLNQRCYGTISLASAASQAGLNWSGRAHSAVADAVMTARVVIDVAEYWSHLQREMNDVSLVKSVTAFDSTFKFNIIKSISCSHNQDYVKLNLYRIRLLTSCTSSVFAPSDLSVE